MFVNIFLNHEIWNIYGNNLEKCYFQWRNSSNRSFLHTQCAEEKVGTCISIRVKHAKDSVKAKQAVTASFQFACVKYCWRFTWIYFRCRLPFRPACHHDNSPHTVELPPDPDPVQTDRPLEMLRISWNVAWHGGMEKLLKHLAQSKNSSQKDKMTE